MIYKPDSVANHHSSLQPTRKHIAGHYHAFYLVLLQMGFAQLLVSPPKLVSSYLTVSPLPSDSKDPRRFGFCGTFLKVTLTAFQCSILPCGVWTFLPYLFKRSNTDGPINFAFLNHSHDNIPQLTCHVSHRIRPNP